jgi:hypothetical protein
MDISPMLSEKQPQVVAGSIPALANGGIAQSVRALHCGCRVTKKNATSIKRQPNFKVRFIYLLYFPGFDPG